jgi:hypothetical protein
MTGVRYLAAIVAVVVAMIVLYFGAVLQIYVLAWVIEGIGRVT